MSAETWPLWRNRFRLVRAARVSAFDGTTVTLDFDNGSGDTYTPDADWLTAQGTPEVDDYLAAPPDGSYVTRYTAEGWAAQGFQKV